MLVLALFAEFAVPGAANACMCGALPLNTEDERRQAIAREFDRSDAVFLGQVSRLNEFWVEFQVLQVWKGEVGGSEVLAVGTEALPGGYIRA